MMVMANLIPLQHLALSHLMLMLMVSFIKNQAKKLKKLYAKMENVKQLSVQMDFAKKPIKFFRKINKYQ